MERDTPPNRKREPADRDPGQPLHSLADDIQGRIRQAELQVARSAYASHRDSTRLELGAPQRASRGGGDCLLLVLLPLALILLVVHPVPGIMLLVVVGWLYLAGSDRRRRDLAAIEAADAEAERRWRQRGGALGGAVMTANPPEQEPTGRHTARPSGPEKASRPSAARDRQGRRRP